jgi:hypothetical protein
MEREEIKPLYVHKKLENIVFWISFLIIIAVIAILALMSIVMVISKSAH